MSFDKHYPNRKDRRKPYYDSRRFDASCRNNKGCPACQSKRLHKYRRQAPIVTVEEILDYEDQ